MSTFIMLTHLSHQALQSPASLDELGRSVTARIHEECPDVDWISSYAVMGPADYLDVFDAPDLDTAMKVATVVRTFGHATTEVWGAMAWDRFRDAIREVPQGAQTADI